MTNTQKTKRRSYLYSYAVTPSKDIPDDYLATVAEFPGLSCVDDSPLRALDGLVMMVGVVIADLESNGEPVPAPGGGR